MRLAKTLIKKEIERCNRSILNRKQNIDTISAKDSKIAKSYSKETLAATIKFWKEEIVTFGKVLKELEVDFKKL